MKQRTRRATVMFAVTALAASVLPALAARPVEAAAATPPPVACVGSPCWKPPANTSWQIQLQGKIKTTFDVKLYDLDLFDTPTATINTLHAAGRKVACYFSAGSFEDWRSDASRFPASVKGASNGWPGEQWLDIRRLDLLMPIMESRLDLCRQRGFDTVDPDNMDGYTNTTGFPLTAADQIAFNATIANAAHARGLTVALKNDLNQTGTLVAYFDWALNEQCFAYQECGLLAPFTNAGKAVMTIEYKGGLKKFCPSANAMNFNTLKKALALKAPRKACR